ncbi:MAG: hypothetical protein Q9168_004702 [Polycauliona sp. 1 TL-2023]
MILRWSFSGWDVACIDQTPESADKAREIGRQAKIFKGAAQVYVWLTTHDKAFVLEWASRMDTQCGVMCSSGFPTQANIGEWLEATEKLVIDVVADPRFTSLWTLQETILSPTAETILSDAMKGDIDLFRLTYLREMLETFRHELRYDESMREAGKNRRLDALI